MKVDYKRIAIDFMRRTLVKNGYFTDSIRYGDAKIVESFLYWFPTYAKQFITDVVEIDDSEKRFNPADVFSKKYSKDEKELW